MAEVELKVIINGVELEFEGEYEDMVKFYNLVKKDFLGAKEKESSKKSEE